MPEVDLTIIANNQEFMKTMNESRKAEGDFYSDWQKNMNTTADQHEDIMKGMQDELKRLGISEEEFLKKYKQAADGQMGILEQLNDDLRTFKKLKESATTTQDIEKFNKKIGETEKEINKLSKGGAKSNDSFSKLKSGFMKMFAVLGGGYLVMQGFNKLMSVSGSLGDKFAESVQGAKSGVNYFFKALTGGKGSFDGFLSGMNNAIKAGREYAKIMDELQDKRVALSFKEADAGVKYQEYMNIIRNVNKTEDERRLAAKKLIALEDEIAKQRGDISEKSYKATLTRVSAENKLGEQQVESFIKQEQGYMILLKMGEDYYNKSVENVKNSDKLKTEIITNQYGMATAISNFDALLAEELKKRPYLTEKYEELQQLKNINDSEREELKKYYEEVSASKKEFLSKTGKAQRVQDALDAFGNKEKIKDEKKTDDTIAKQREEFLKLLEDLQKRYQEAQLEGLSGKERIDKEQEFALKELEIFKTTLESKGKLTKEQYSMIEVIKTSITKKGDLEREKLANENNLKRAGYDRALLSSMLDNAEDEIDLSRKTEEEKLQLKIAAYKNAVEMLSTSNDAESKAMSAGLKRSIQFMAKDLQDLQIPKEFDFEQTMWKALGIDTKSEDGQFQAKWMTEYANSVVSSLGTIIEAEANLAAQRRQNAENRISELESQLDEELALQEQGLANNVNAVKKELEQVKAEKQKAQEQEKQLQAAQMALDTVTQVSSLITASANIFKAFSKIPIIGVPLAWAAIASMFGLMTVAKVKAAQASKMEQGGYIDEYGVIQGKRHSDGGESLNRHVEVEQGEGVGVFNRNATQYYGGMLPKWVQSINNKNFPKFDIKPELRANQVFDLKTSSMNSELKAIKIGIDNLNSNILSQTQTNHKQGVRIEKQGNRTRIVHEKN
jgi:hypothetical protein